MVVSLLMFLLQTVWVTVGAVRSHYSVVDEYGMQSTVLWDGGRMTIQCDESNNLQIAKPTGKAWPRHEFLDAKKTIEITASVNILVELQDLGGSSVGDGITIVCGDATFYDTHFPNTTETIRTERVIIKTTTQIRPRFISSEGQCSLQNRLCPQLGDALVPTPKLACGTEGGTTYSSECQAGKHMNSDNHIKYMAESGCGKSGSDYFRVKNKDDNPIHVGDLAIRQSASDEFYIYWGDVDVKQRIACVANAPTATPTVNYPNPTDKYSLDAETEVAFNENIVRLDCKGGSTSSGNLDNFGYFFVADGHASITCAVYEWEVDGWGDINKKKITPPKCQVPKWIKTIGGAKDPVVNEEDCEDVDSEDYQKCPVTCTAITLKHCAHPTFDNDKTEGRGIIARKACRTPNRPRPPPPPSTTSTKGPTPDRLTLAPPRTGQTAPPRPRPTNHRPYYPRTPAARDRHDGSASDAVILVLVSLTNFLLGGMAGFIFINYDVAKKLRGERKWSKKGQRAEDEALSLTAKPDDPDDAHDVTSPDQSSSSRSRGGTSSHTKRNKRSHINRNA